MPLSTVGPTKEPYGETTYPHQKALTLNPTLNLIETIEDALAFRRWLGERRPYLAIDTETTGLSWWTPHFLRTAQFGDAETGWTIPMEWWGRLVKDSVEAYTGPTVMHNSKFDIHALESAGIRVDTANLHDTQVMAWLLDPPGRTALKTLSRLHVDPQAAVGQSLLHQAMRRNHWDWASVPVDLESYWAYAALDTVLTARLAEKLWPQVKAADLTEAYEMEMAVADVLRQAETRGVRLDLEYTHALKFDWEVAMAGQLKALHERGIANPNAAAQIAAALKSEGWEADEFTPSGQPKLSENVLKGIDSETSNLILEYRKLRKWTSTYLEAFIQRADGDRLHPSIHALRARTGRMSVTEPALQTLPRGPEIRDCVIPSDGNVLLSVDYSQIELRLLAHFANERPMIDAFLSGEDLHADTARRIYGPDFTKAQRSISKNGNFAKVYGAGVRKFAQTTGITESEAQAFMTRYEQTYPGVQTFMRQVEHIAADRLRQEGKAYVRTAGGHRLPADHDKLYTLVNFLCQGTAAEVLKTAILNLDAAGLTEGLVLPVHDELIFDLDPKDWDEVVPEIRKMMEDHTNFQVPLTVEASGQLDRWGSAYR